jgi:hypothetical protein
MELVDQATYNSFSIDQNTELREKRKMMPKLYSLFKHEFIQYVVDSLSYGKNPIKSKGCLEVYRNSTTFTYFGWMI